MSPRTNPALFPGDHNRVGHRFDPPTLGVLVTEATHVAHHIGQVLLNAGFIFPPEDVIERHAVTFSTNDGICVQFPPPLPGLGDRVTVVDTAWRSAEVAFTEVTAETLGHPHARLYFDLSTGLWITFSAGLLPTSISTDYRSQAARHPIPTEADHA